MARTLKSTLNFLVRDPIMDYGPSADYGKCSKEPNWFASSVFMLLPFFCNCLHSLFFYGSLLYHKSTFLRSVPGSFRDFPAPRIGAARRDASPYHWFRGSGLPNVTCKVQAPLQNTPFYTLHFTFFRPGGGRKMPPTEVKDQSAFRQRLQPINRKRRNCTISQHGSQ